MTSSTNKSKTQKQVPDVGKAQVKEKAQSQTQKPVEEKPLNKSGSLKLLWQLALPHYKKILLSAFLVMLVNASLILKPYILKLVIDDFLVKHMASRGFYSITLLGLLYLALVVLGSGLTIAQVNLINQAGQQIMLTLRRRVYRTIQLLPLSRLDKMTPGKLITRATNDVEALSELYTDVVISLFSDVFLLIGIIYTMLAMNVKLALISFSVVPIMFLVVIVLKKKIRLNFEKMKSLIGKINGFMAENISGMRLIQIFRAEQEKRTEFNELNHAFFNSALFQVWMNSFLKPAADLLQSFAVVIILWYGMGRIAGHTLEIGVLFAFTSYIKQFFNPIADLADNYTTIQSALVSADRIHELLALEDTLEDLESGMRVDKLHGDIEFKHVWFAYNDKDWVLKDASFKVKRGETVAFIGETGAGKTTIISLINRFYTIQKGEILIDGININDINLADLRRSIAVVLQDVFLFSGDIKRNISLNDDIEEHEVLEALKISNSEDFVSSMDGGVNEPVMERGSTFSAGQRQLLSFARAIAHEPSIFVLDEATANIDTHTEKLIQAAVENVSRDRSTTTLIIAHRLSTIRNADKIIVLRHGRILETGSHAQLVQSGGYYSSLLQKGGNAFTEADGETA